MEHNSVNRLRLDSSFEHNIFIGNFFYFVKYLYLLIKYKTNTAYWKQTTWNKWFFQPVNESKWLHDSINVEQKAEQRTNRFFVSRLVVGYSLVDINFNHFPLLHWMRILHFFVYCRRRRDRALSFTFFRLHLNLNAIFMVVVHMAITHGNNNRYFAYSTNKMRTLHGLGL